MELILILCVPLVIGSLWGFWQARDQRFSVAVWMTAPVVSASSIGVMFALMNMLDPPVAVLARPLSVRMTIYLATGCLYGAGFGIFGAVPALVGSAATQSATLWLNWSSGKRSAGRDDQVVEAAIDPSNMARLDFRGGAFHRELADLHVVITPGDNRSPN